MPNVLRVSLAWISIIKNILFCMDSAVDHPSSNFIHFISPRFDVIVGIGLGIRESSIRPLLCAGPFRTYFHSGNC